MWPNGRMQVGLLFGVCVLSATMCRGGARIEGTVALGSAGPKPAPVSRYQAKTPVGPPEPVSAVVYLEGNFPHASTTNSVEMGQKNYQFTPGVLPIQKGSTITFPNFDDDYHNVFSFSKAKRFDLGKYRKDERPASQKFDEAGVVKLFCEIHEHMRGTILVLDTPYFVKTDKDGKFALENLPAGSFKLKAWLDEKMVLEKTVDLVDGKTVRVEFGGK